MKWDPGTKVTTSGGLAYFAVFLKVAGFFANLWNVFVRLADPDAHREPVTSRPAFLNIANRVAAFRKVVGSKRTIRVTLVTANGLKHNVYWNNVQSEIGLDDLFT